MNYYNVTWQFYFWTNNIGYVYLQRQYITKRFYMINYSSLKQTNQQTQTAFEGENPI